MRKGSAKSAINRSSKKPQLSEAEFLRMVLDLARLCGWRTFHVRPGRTNKGWRTPCQGDAKGWPDLVLVRGQKILCVELKVGKGRLTDEQEDWLAALSNAGVPATIWRPEMWALIQEVLQ